ncbi:MAG: TonB-dependent receptor [Cyclobacteriaceae bacterium]|nr:MAG: TonB-dependent receptor [Cyclobacteriaceae bacterium]
MFKRWIAATVMLLPFVLPGQSRLEGIVRDARTQQPLSGATVQLLNSGKIAVTDDQGRFVFTGLSENSAIAEVRFLGYKPVRTQLAAGTVTTVDLEEGITFTDEVIVTATRASGKTPTTFSTVDKITLRKQNFGQDMPLLLNWTPSVVTTSDAGNGIGYTYINIRGSDATRINVTLNGIPYNDSESQGVFWVDIPDIASSTENIQIQRGVGTSTNGPGAFGATINLQTLSQRSNPYAEIIQSAGSFNTWRTTAGFGTGLLNNHWTIDGRFSRITSDGFIDRASSRLQSYYFSAGYNTRRTTLKAVVFGGHERTYQSWYGVPESRLRNDTTAMLITAANEGWDEEQTAHLLSSNSRTFNIYTYKDQVDDYAQDHYQLHAAHRFAQNLTGNMALHYTYGRGFYEEFRKNDRLSRYGLSSVIIGDSVISRTDIIRRRWLDNDFYGFTYSLQYESASLSLTWGGAWNRYDGRHFGEIIWARVSDVPKDYRYYYSDARKTDFNSFFKATWQINDRLSLFGDVQVRTIDYQTAGNDNRQNTFDVDVEYTFFNPKAGLTCQLNSTAQLYMSYAVANREPVRRDFIDNPFNQWPRPERLGNLEAGYRLQNKNYALNANLYWMNYKDQLVLTGELNDVGAAIRTNVDRSYRAGIELDFTGTISPRLIWSGNITLSRNKIKEFTEVLYNYGDNWEFDPPQEVRRTYRNTDIAMSPNFIAGSVLAYKPVQRTEVALLSKYVGRQFLDNTSNKSRSIPEYFINDLRLSYSFKTARLQEVSFSFIINNLLDVAYESNGYTWGYLGGGVEYRENYFYPQAGRHALAMLRIAF